MRRWLTVLSITAFAQVTLATELQGFSFEYQISGDRSIAPYQVFDDGISMFLQFRDSTKVPAIFIRDARGARIATPDAQGSYVRIPGLAQRLELVSERRTATIVSTRKRPLVVPAPAHPMGVHPAGSVPAAAPSQAQAPLPIGHVRPASLEHHDVRTQLESLRKAVDALVKRANATPVATAALHAVGSGAAGVNSGATETEALVLEVEAGQRLSIAVRRFLSVHRLDLDWDTGGADFEVRFGFRVVGASVEEVLFGALNPFKLSAVAHRGNRVVAVTRAS